MSKKDRIVCGLDPGSTKICLIVARLRDSGSLEILGVGHAESAGFKRGVVVDLEQAAECIRKAVAEAETKAGVSVDWVAVGLSGEGVQSFNCRGAVPIEGKNHEVTHEDMAKVVRAAQSVPVPGNRQLIHVLPQEFFLDDWGDIRNPVGLTGSRLDADVHVVSVDASLVQNLINTVNHAAMRVRRVILQILASAESVLTPEEREIGTAVVDIGGGTTDIAILFRNAIRFTSVIPVGGSLFSRDLAIGLRTPIEDAECLKTTVGTLLTDTVVEDEMIDVPEIGTRNTRQLPRKAACRILRDRATELMELIRAQIDRGCERGQLLGGVVLTGGGSLLPGMVELAEQVLEVPARLGFPLGVQGLTDELNHPAYACVIGLAVLSTRPDIDPRKFSENPGHLPPLISRVLSWVES
ncbi:MAG: cell division protein FtsA [Acidobacteria bacterium]|nr:cell division protein FtsA [Acidobacteriota bacterium]